MCTNHRRRSDQSQSWTIPGDCCNRHRNEGRREARKKQALKWHQPRLLPRKVVLPRILGPIPLWVICVTHETRPEGVYIRPLSRREIPLDIQGKPLVAVQCESPPWFEVHCGDWCLIIPIIGVTLTTPTARFKCH